MSSKTNLLNAQTSIITRTILVFCVLGYTACQVFYTTYSILLVPITFGIILGHLPEATGSTLYPRKLDG